MVVAASGSSGSNKDCQFKDAADSDCILCDAGHYLDDGDCENYTSDDGTCWVPNYRDTDTDCLICEDYESDRPLSATKSDCEPCEQSIENYFMQYHDCIECEFTGADDNVDGCYACSDHYLNGGRCDPTCGVDGYGSATYSHYGKPSSNQCNNCDNSCHECNGAGTGRCLSCPADEYLARTSDGAGSYYQYGTCTAKADYNPCSGNLLPPYSCPATITFDLYVNPPGSNGNAAENIDGSSGNRFNYL